MGAAGAMTMDSIADGDVRITVSDGAVVNKSEVLGWGGWLLPAASTAN